MPKKLLLILTIMSMCLLFACTSKNRTDKFTDSSNASQKPQISAPLKTLTLPRGYYAHSGALTTDMFFEVADYGERYNVVFTDVATRQQLFLCSQLNCEHVDERCLSYFKNIPFVFENYFETGILAIIFDGNLSEFEGHYSLYELNFNGSREKVCEMPDNFYFDSVMIAGDEENIYFIAADIEQDYDKFLIALSLKTKKVSVLQQCDNNTYLLGAAENQIFFLKQNNESGEELYSYNLLDNKYQKIHNLVAPIVNNGNRLEPFTFVETACLCGGIAFVYNKERGSLQKINLLTMQSEKISEISLVGDIFLTYADERYLIISANDYEVDKHSIIMVDIESKVANEITLKIDRPLKDKSIIPVAIFGDYALVEYALEQVQIKTQNISGNDIFVDAMLPKRALISTFNYFNSKEDFLPIDDAYLIGNNL